MNAGKCLPEYRHFLCSDKHHINNNKNNNSINDKNNNKSNSNRSYDNKVKETRIYIYIYIYIYMYVCMYIDLRRIVLSKNIYFFCFHVYDYPLILA